MKLILAPMEGLTDPNMRHLLTKIGQFDWCVSEFIRVTNVLLPDSIFFKYCPEAVNGWKTQFGTPLHPQLLGNDPIALAENAAKLASLGAPAIDLNFGCPAKTVNRHRGGAVLLDETELLHKIGQAVRKAVPKHIPVSAKMRLGNETPAPALQNALALEAAGISWLTVHARCKTDGYNPPAYWEQILPLKQQLHINVIANGEIWNERDATSCQQKSGCNDLMLGRGAVTRPDLSARLKQGASMDWKQMLAIQLDFLAYSNAGIYEASGFEFSEQGLIGRYKQWLGMLTQGYHEAVCLWHCLKKERSKDAIVAHILKRYEAMD